eukprot:TRINITY_DN55134_c0_g1_i1.p1 TRINITY_DN55134_c0_g1~~TRINITY_DN55134_c0_g1_i1.p1  ORF type:complete len:856 (+),score=240.38 TRINITY_DN55134_c0_g1_i1:81-2570(+)
MLVYLQVLGCDGTGTPTVLLYMGEQRFMFNVPEGTQRYCTESKVKMGKVQGIFLTRLHPDTLLGLPGMLLTLSDMDRLTRKNKEEAAHAHRKKKERGPGKAAAAPDKHMDVYGPFGTVLLMRQLRPFVRCQEFYGARDVTGPPSQVAAAAAAGEEELLPCFRSDRPPLSVTALHWEGGLLYCATLDSQPGTFLPDKAEALGVKKGPKFGRLQRGESVQSDADPARTVLPEEVCDGTVPTRRAVIADGGQAGAAAQLPAALQRLAAALDRVDGPPGGSGRDSVCCVLHLAAVPSDPEYRAACSAAFPSAAHLYSPGERLLLRPTVFHHSAGQHAKLRAFAPIFFPPERGSGSEASGNLEDPGGRDEPPAPPPAGQQAGAWIPMRPLQTYYLAPSRRVGVQSDECRPELHQVLRQERAEWPELLLSALSTADPELQGAAEAGAAGAAAPPGGSSGPIQMWFLGTGGMMPSRYRNVSATLCALPCPRGGGDGAAAPPGAAAAAARHVLLDAGEGTLGQLARIADPAEVLSTLELVWISHMHADHHLGLPSLLHYRHQVLSAAGGPVPPVHVVGPDDLGPYLMYFERICRTPMSYRFSTCAKLDSASGGGPTLDLLGGAATLKCVKVDHCPDAWGCVLAGRWHPPGAADPADWKAVFSGDCRPTDALVDAGAGCDVLVHEATFEDDKLQDAEAKRHSTVGGALGVARRMEARCTVLTHFSQRYYKVPPPGAEGRGTVGLAFDLMRMGVGQEHLLAKLAEPVRILARFYDGLEEDRVEKAKEELQRRREEANKRKGKGERRKEDPHAKRRRMPEGAPPPASSADAGVAAAAVAD